MSGLLDLPRLRESLARLTSSQLERPRRAAVALVLAERPSVSSSPSVLLVRRSERVGDPWSGHMALPGGHAQAGDHDLLHTAQRETLEEVGLDLSTSELLGSLDDITPMRSSEISVRPFVFWADRSSEARPSDEVSEVIWVPLAELTGGALKRTQEVRVGDSTLNVPAFVIDERVVWGMTYRLLERFLERIGAQG